MGLGYANRVIKLDFKELSGDWAADPVWVIIRNPKLLPPAELQSLAGDGSTGWEQERDAAGNPVTGEDGTPKLRISDPDKAQQRLRDLICRLVVAARVYDATAAGEFDPETGEQRGDQPRLPPTPWTAEIAARLPLEIVKRIASEFTEAANPPSGQGANIQKTSSGQPSPSSTEPGPAEPAPQN